MLWNLVLKYLTAEWNIPFSEEITKSDQKLEATHSLNLILLIMTG